MYRLIPGDIQKVNFIGFTFESLYFESIELFVWTLLNKLLPLIAFSWIFIRIKETWTYSMFVPISMYLFQSISIVNNDLQTFDKVEIFYCLPILFVYCLLLFYYKRFLNRIKASREYDRELVLTGLKSILSSKNEK